MPFAESYRRQVALLLRTLPAVVEEDCFALKGGTAINLFVRDLPRLSVDIDLTYLPIHDRPSSLTAIYTALVRRLCCKKHPFWALLLVKVRCSIIDTK